MRPPYGLVLLVERGGGGREEGVWDMLDLVTPLISFAPTSSPGKYIL